MDIGRTLVAQTIVRGDLHSAPQGTAARVAKLTLEAGVRTRASLAYERQVNGGTRAVPPVTRSA
jgi:hypothetical protein